MKTLKENSDIDSDSHHYKLPKSTLPPHLLIGKLGSKHFHLNLCYAEEACKDGGIAIDCGANSGGFTRSFTNWGIDTIHAIEASPGMVRILTEKFGAVPNVHIHHMAVSDTSGILKGVTLLSAWTLGAEGQYKNLAVSPGALEESGDTTFDVSMETLDTLIGSKHWKDVRFMKIDVDGYDYKALVGAKNIIAASRPLIYIEVSTYYDVIEGSSSGAFLDWLGANNYEIALPDGHKISHDALRYHWPYGSSHDVYLYPSEKGL